MHTSAASSAGSSFPTEAFDFTVHSVFPRAVNLRPVDGSALLSLVADGALRHPRAALVAQARFDGWGLRPGEEGRFDGEVLKVPAATVFVPASRRSSVEESMDGRNPVNRSFLEAAARLVADAASTKGMAGAGFERALEKASVALNKAVEVRSVEAAVLACAALIGLGPGLTPAGDDFLCGALAGWRAQAGADPELQRFLVEFERAFRRADLASATSDVSAAFLSEALAGRFGASLLAFARAALGEGELEGTVAVLADLGATSGLDAARGFLFAFREIRGG